MTLSFTLTMQSDKVVGYELSMDSSTSVDDGEGGQITTTTAMPAAVTPMPGAARMTPLIP